MSSTAAARLADRLLEDGVLTTDQREMVLHRIQESGARFEDAVIETGAVSEADLLKYLARIYRTRFVLTQKLARVDVERSLLDMVPRKIADRLLVFPVLFDPASATLSVVSPDAGNPDVAREVQVASNTRDVKVYVARPASVRAAIAKHYGGDLYAFAHIDTQGLEQYRSLIDLYDRSSIAPEAQAPVAAAAAEKQRPRVLTEREVEHNARPAQVLTDAYLETVTVLVSLLENGRSELRGHSAVVARLLRKLAERIGLTAAEVGGLVMAALLHDVGKTSTYHLTALNVAEYENHRAVAQKCYLTPVRLFESVPLGSTAINALQGMYERFDGDGFPDAATAKDISLGARLLAVADTYADLTQNPRNPYRKILAPAEACDVLDMFKQRVFDPNLVDLVRQVVLGEDLRNRLLASRPVVLLVDPDPEENTVLELRLMEQGFDARAARNAEGAIALLRTNEIECVVAETDLHGSSGFDLLAELRAVSRDLPWLFLTRDARRESVARAYELGVSDYVIKPVPTEVLVAKLQQIFARPGAHRARGVVGSLTEMALSDIIQIVAQGRKSGQLRIQAGPEQGEIHFHDGTIVNAMWARLRGEEAFYAMLGLTAGEFALDPAFKPPARVIQASVESLLLEGMRRLDEGVQSRS